MTSVRRSRLMTVAAVTVAVILAGGTGAVARGVDVNGDPTRTADDVAVDSAYWSPTWGAGQTVVFDGTVLTASGKSYAVHTVIRSTCQGQGSLIPMG